MHGHRLVCFLLHLSCAFAPQALPGTLLFGVRTFLWRLVLRRLQRRSRLQQRSVRRGLRPLSSRGELVVAPFASSSCGASRAVLSPFASPKSCLDGGRCRTRTYVALAGAGVTTRWFCRSRQPSVLVLTEQEWKRWESNPPHGACKALSPPWTCAPSSRPKCRAGSPRCAWDPASCESDGSSHGHGGSPRGLASLLRLATGALAPFASSVAYAARPVGCGWCVKITTKTPQCEPLCERDAVWRPQERYRKTGPKT